MFLNPLFEGDFPCSQIHQHHDEDRRPDDSFEDDETQDMNEEVYLANESCTSSSYEEGLLQTRKGDTKSDMCEEEIALKHGAENFQSILGDQTLGERENVLLEDKPFSKPCCEEKQYLKYGADCVEKGIQEDICPIDQIHDHWDLLFSKDHIAPHDLSKASKTDTKNFIDEMEPMNIFHEDGAPTMSLMFGQHTEMMKGKHIMIKRKKVLHDQTRVFDRGKTQCSLLGGLGPPNLTLHHIKHGCLVCSSRDSWNLIISARSICPRQEPLMEPHFWAIHHQEISPNMLNTGHLNIQSGLDLQHEFWNDCLC